MNFFIYLGGWFVGYWIIGVLMFFLEVIAKSYGWDLNPPNTYYIIGAWTSVWVWVCYRFIHKKEL